uniref:CCHC-type domain-containing protein n=1 Tax=Ananas comosus var. bracteatus TaxID=296719 RepID=A0A6V7NY66_ANACO|nr:unnamed protein product [Ananas comosus var. bracteatus]
MEAPPQLLHCGVDPFRRSSALDLRALRGKLRPTRSSQGPRDGDSASSPSPPSRSPVAPGPLLVSPSMELLIASPHTALHHPLRPSGPLSRTAFHHPPRARGPLPYPSLHHHRHPTSLPGVHNASYSGSRVQPGFSFKEAILAPHHTTSGSAPRSTPIPPISDPALPLHPPKFLLNTSLKGRCFRCFERRHRAARCREPRRCLLCMRIGHPASSCKFQRLPMRRALEPGPSSNRPSTIASFLPSRLPPPGHPSLVGRVALVETRGQINSNVKEILSRGLAARFGGSGRDYLVANFQASTMAVFFPSWLARGSAVGRSPLRFEGIDFFLSKWVEAGEMERGHLAHKAWIRLHNWPILCWNEEDIKAAVSGFGELWAVDPLSEQMADVSFSQACVRCQNVHSIPEDMILTVDDRRFRIPIEIESWEQANPILFSEELDDHLGIVSIETQNAFLRQTGFNAYPASRTDRSRTDRSRTDRRSSLKHRRLVLDGQPAPGERPPPGPPVLCSETQVVLPTSSCQSASLTAPCLGSKEEGKAALGPTLTNPGPSELGVSLNSDSRPNELPHPQHEPTFLGGLINAALGSPWADSSPVGPNFHLDGQPSDSPTPGLSSPHSGSPILRHPPSLDSSLSSLDTQPVLRAGPMGANRFAPAKLFPSRRSLRLAAKCRGSKKSSLQRAQEIMCKKIKMVRFAAKNVRPPSSRSATPLPADDSASEPPVPESESAPPFPHEPSNGTTLTTSSAKDPAFPLTPEEIHQILATCGVLNNDARSPKTAGIASEVGEHSGGV